MVPMLPGQCPGIGLLLGLYLMHSWRLTAKAVFNGIPVDPDSSPNFKHQVALVDRWEKKTGNTTVKQFYAVCGGTLLTKGQVLPNMASWTLKLLMCVSDTIST